MIFDTICQIVYMSQGSGAPPPPPCGGGGPRPPVESGAGPGRRGVEVPCWPKLAHLGAILRDLEAMLKYAELFVRAC